MIESKIITNRIVIGSKPTKDYVYPIVRLFERHNEVQLWAIDKNAPTMEELIRLFKKSFGCAEPTNRKRDEYETEKGKLTVNIATLAKSLF